MQDWKIFAIGSAIFAGLTAVFAKIGVKNIPSNLAAFIRTCVVLFLIGILVAIRREWQSSAELDKRSLIFLVLSGLTTGLSWICYYRALQTGPVSLVSPIDKLSLVFAVLLSVLFLKEQLNLYQWIGAALIGSGALIIVFK